VRLLLGLFIAAALVAAIYGAVTLIRPNDPAVANDWPTATPVAVGFARAGFERETERLPRQHKGIFALLVARHGKLAFEHYYHDYPYKSRSGFELYSITKSVTSALVGIAMAEGRIKGLDQPLRHFFSKWTPRRARAITLRELLSMRTGWPGENDPRSDVGNPPNLIRALLQRPIVHKPGTTFDYDSASTHVVSAILTRVTGMSEERYAKTRLFAPLAIQIKDFWPKDEHGITYGGNGLALSARDALKLGQLYLQHGRWHGRQIVPRRWVSKSTSQQVAFRGGHGYAYGWWTRTHNGSKAYFALGYGGQIIAVVPKLDLAVAVFSDPAYPEISPDELVDRIAATVQD
jgi:CubicO group peptidase (beta-lactamase class C family)